MFVLIIFLALFFALPLFIGLKMPYGVFVIETKGFNASEFHAILWNLNYGTDVIKENQHVIKETEDVVKDVVKETEDVVKAKGNVTKEFVKAQRQIYKLISQTPQINATQMSDNMGISLRQVQRYLKQLSELNLIVREGGRKNGFWKILDDEYEGFFKRI